MSVDSFLLVVVLVINMQLCLQTVARESLRQDGTHCLVDPGRQAGADRPRDLLRLTRRRGDGVALLEQVRHERTDVVGQVDILGEPVNDPVDLGQRRAALEGQRLGEGRGVDRGERSDHPEVLFQEVSRASAFGRGIVERFREVPTAERVPGLRHAGSPR